MSFNSLSDLRKARGSFDNLMKEVEKIDSPQQSTTIKMTERVETFSRFCW
jgi:hypothetical protein